MLQLWQADCKYKKKRKQAYIMYNTNLQDPSTRIKLPNVTITNTEGITVILS